MKAGDVVRLKSGGPNMAVEKRIGGYHYTCVRIHEDGRTIREDFHENLLARADR